jgi:hypothetical protein
MRVHVQGFLSHDGWTASLPPRPAASSHEPPTISHASQPTELIDGNVSSSESRGHAEASNGRKESDHHP